MTYSIKYIDRIAYKPYIGSAVPQGEEGLVSGLLKSIIPGKATQCAKLKNEGARSSSTCGKLGDVRVPRELHIQLSIDSPLGTP